MFDRRSRRQPAESGAEPRGQWLRRDASHALRGKQAASLVLAKAFSCVGRGHGIAAPAVQLFGAHERDDARIAQVQGRPSTGRRIEYLAAPRLIALAERAWAADPGWRLVRDERERAASIDNAWNEFANRLGQLELPRLDRMPLAYGYRLPPPGAVLRDGAFHANVALPGLALRYTTDGSEPDSNSPRYLAPVNAARGTAVFKIATFDTRGRKSRTVAIDVGDTSHA